VNVKRQCRLQKPSILSMKISIRFDEKMTNFKNLIEMNRVFEQNIHNVNHQRVEGFDESQTFKIYKKKKSKTVFEETIYANC
jgi:hypothetical protein